MSDNLLEVNNLKTYFYTEDGVVRAVDGVDFQIKKGETLGIVGESGCGKSVTSLSILRLIPNPPGKIIDGEILFKGQNLLSISEADMRKIRGNDISMIFQEPMTSLNPVFTVGEQVAETIELHHGNNKKEAIKKAIEILSVVGIPAAEKRVNDFPHQMSVGMRQRVMIAMALSCTPSLLIADEPTSALDVTIQAQILELMKDLKKEFGTAIILITHDLGVVAEMVENILVMYAGKVVEYTDVRTIFKEPKHPYTIGLMGSIPRLDQPKEKLFVIEGSVPNSYQMPEGCRFHPRCSQAREICTNKEPELISINGHLVRCWKYSNLWKGAKTNGI